MKTHTIYHIPGVKVGCTINFVARKTQYPEGTNIEIIEVLEEFDDELAGDREWDWADHYGYSRGGHYKNTWNHTLTVEMRSAAGKKGAETIRENKTGLFDPSHYVQINGAMAGASKGGSAAQATLKTKQVSAFYDPELKKEICSKGGTVTGLRGTSGFSQGNVVEYTCPRCQQTGKGFKFKAHINKGTKNVYSLHKQHRPRSK